MKLLHGLFILILTATMMYSAKAQEKKVAPTTPELYKEVAAMDSLLFHAYNTQDLEKFRSMFTDDFEWFQDNAGVLSPKQVFEGIESNFKKDFKLTRSLVKGSLDVHPIKGYGAITTGIHQFRHVENGKEETATYKYLMIWQHKNGQWKVSKVVSYDH